MCVWKKKGKKRGGGGWGGGGVLEQSKNHFLVAILNMVPFDMYPCQSQNMELIGAFIPFVYLSGQCGSARTYHTENPGRLFVLA